MNDSANPYSAAVDAFDTNQGVPTPANDSIDSGESKIGPGVDPYSSAVDAFDQARETQARALNVSVQRGDPDKAARALDISQQLGVPAPAVQQQLPQFEERLAPVKSSSILSKNPILQNWLINNPDHAKIGGDDFDSLDGISKTFRAWTQGMDAGAAANERARLEYQGLAGPLSTDTKARIGDIDQQMQSQETGTYGNRFLNAVNWVSRNIVGGLYDQAKQSTPLAAEGAGVGAGIGAAATGLPSVGTLAPVGAATGAVVGAGAGFGAGFYSDSFKIGAGQLFDRLSQTRGPNGEPMDPNIVEGASVLGGLMYAGLNTFGLGKVGVAPIESAAKSFAADAISEALTRPTVQQAVGRFMGEVAKGGSQGALLGAAIESSMVGAEQSARALSGFSDVANDPQQRQEAIDRIADSAEQMAFLAGATHAIPGGVSFMRDTANARQAVIDAKGLQDLQDGVATSKTASRSRDAVLSFLKQQADGSPVENIGIPGAKVQELYQSLGLDAFDLAHHDDPVFGFVDDMPEQLHQALTTGGDVQIPTADFLAHLSGTPVANRLLPDVRVRPDGMTLREAQEFEQNKPAILAQQAGALRDAVNSAVAAGEPVDRVRNDVTAQLRNAGATGDEANQDAALVAARYSARAHRMDGAVGNAWDAYQSSGLNVQRELTDNRLTDVPVDHLDMLINALRNGTKLPSDKDIYGPSLAEFIARNGGVDDVGGEFHDMGADQWHKDKPGMPRLVHAVADDGAGNSLPGVDAVKSERHPDSVTRHAWESGYFPDHGDERPSSDDLYSAIRDEMAGNPRYAGTINEGKLGFRTGVQNLDAALREMGVDPSKLSNPEIKNAIKKWRAEGETGREFHQPVNEGVNLDQHMTVVDVPKVASGDWKGERGAALTNRVGKAGIDLKNPDMPGDVHLSSNDWKHAVQSFQKSVDAVGHDDAALAHFDASRMLPELFSESALVESHDATKPNEPDVEKVHRFFAAMGHGDDRYAVKLTVEQYKDGSGALVVDGVKKLDKLHDMHLAKKMPAEGTFERTPDAGALSQLQPQTPSLENIGTSDTVTGVTLRDLIRGVKGEDGHDYAQNERGKIRLTDGKAMVSLFQNADRSTFLHEMGHLWLDELVRDAQHPDAPQGLKDDLSKVLDWFGVDHPDKITDDQHEKFARGFEHYLMEGKAPSSELTGAFAKFKTWLTAIYRTVKNLGAPINSDIRGVMDRLLATDDEIASVRQQQRLNPIFADAKAAHMTEAEFSAYTRKIKEAQTQAEGKVLEKAMADIRRSQTAEWKTESEAMRPEVDADLRRRPDLAADHFLRTGTDFSNPDSEAATLHRLSRRDLVEMYDGNSSVIDALPRGVTGAKGLHPELAAELLGYRSGDDLVKGLMSLEAQRRDMAREIGRKSVGPGEHFARLVDEETARRMNERHGGAFDTGAIADAAMKAIHGKAQVDVLATEMKALARQVGVTPLTLDHLKGWAASQVADMPTRQAVSSWRFERGEAKAGRAVEAALMKGDIRGAFVAKQQQVINHLMAAETQRAAETFDKGDRLFNSMMSKRAVPSIDQPYLDRIQQMLARFGYDHPRRQPTTFGETLAQWIGNKQAEGWDLITPSFLLDETLSKPVRDLPYDQFQGLKDAVENLEHVGRREREATIDGKRIDFGALRQQAVDQTSALPDLSKSRAATPGKPGMGIREDIFRFKSFVRSMRASMEKVEQVVDLLDGGDPNGVFNRAVWRPLSDGLGKRSDWEGKLSDHFRELANAKERETRNMDKLLPGDHGLIDPETGEPMELTQKNILGIALHTGTEDNFDRLTRGYGWSRDGVMTALDKHMIKEDWDLVQHTWDAFEKTWPEVAEQERRSSGIVPEKIEPRAVDTAFGPYRGGYMRIEYDPIRSPDIALRKARDSDLFESNYTRATTSHGFTIERKEGVNRPIWLDFDRVPSLLREVVHDFSMRDPITEVNRFLTDDQVRKAIVDKLGVEVYDQFRPWLKSIANDRLSDVRELATYQKIFRWARSTATMVRLGYNIKTAILHGGTAAQNSVGELGYHWAKDGAASFFGSPEKMRAATAFVQERSSMMRHRMDEFDRDVRERLQEMMDKGGVDRSGEGVLNYVKDAVSTLGEGRVMPIARDWQRSGFHLLGMLDQGSAIPTWIGGYHKAMSEGMNPEDAGQYADKVVRNAHGGGRIMDMAEVMRGNEFWKSVTMFMTFWNHFVNRQIDLGRRIGRLTQGQANMADVSAIVHRSFWYILLPSLWHGFISGGGKQGDDEGWATWAAKEIGSTMFNGIPVVNHIVDAFTNQRDFSMSPAGDVVNTLMKSGQDVAHLMHLMPGHVSDKWVKHTIETPGYIFGISGAGQVGRTVQYMHDVYTGQENPHGAGEFLKGLVYGPSPK